MRKRATKPIDEKLVVIAFLRAASRDAAREAKVAHEKASAAAAVASAADLRANRLLAALEEVECRGAAVTQTKETDARTAEHASSSGGQELSKRAYVLAAVREVSVEFSAPEIFAWLRGHVPPAVGKIPEDYAYSILWKLTNGSNACLEVIEKRRQGRPTRYRRLRNP